MDRLIEIKEAVPLFPEFRFASPVEWITLPGQQWAVVGPNGAGKTRLIEILTGKTVLKSGSVTVRGNDGRRPGRVKHIEFRDIYSLVDCGNIYYQKRWNASEVDSEPLTEELLAGLPAELVMHHIDRFGMRSMLGKRIISLSSGELRKFLVIRALASEPDVLVIDNPFIGLDITSRALLSDMLRGIAQERGVQIVLVMPDIQDLPAWIDFVLPVMSMNVCRPMGRTAFLEDSDLLHRLYPARGASAPELPAPIRQKQEYDTVIGMDGVTIRYGDRTILDGVEWHVHKGEKWALLGDNGSGKSTLLSLVNADNPQAYANRITLFDRRRGTGESIWEIKDRIGYMNSDLHAFYMKDIPAVDVVVSGFFNTIGLYENAGEQRYDTAMEWMETFGVADLAQRSFVKLSYGEQRTVMLARTFVKDPQVLILDEPMHGLDTGRRALAGRIIDAFSRREGKTLIYVTHYPGEIPPSVTKVKRLTKRS